jgi:uncharacterized protein involved in outer membrane biogenesis
MGVNHAGRAEINFLNTVLSYLAGLIALLLVAALAGPTFVDWNRFRGEFEEQAKKITGRDVTIGGDISFVVLPAPHLTLNNVSVANVAGGENPDFLRVGRVDVEVALIPLLSGEISATSVKIARPQVHLEVNADGVNNWRDLVSISLLRESGFFAPSSVSLEKVGFEEGNVTFNDRRSGRNWRVEHLNGDVVATSLVGPMRAEMSLSVNDIPFAVRVNLGNFSSKKTFKITTEIQTLNTPAKLLFSGISTSFSSDARVDGTAVLELGSTKAVQGEQVQTPLRVEAGVVSNGDAATFRNLIVSMAGTTLKGDAKARWRNRPDVQVNLSGEALTLDPLLDRLEAIAGSGSVPLGGLAYLPVPDWLDGNANFKVGGLLSRDVLIKNANLKLGLKDGVLQIKDASGDIAGGTHIVLAGNLTSGEAPQFSGKLTTSTENLGALALWLESLRAEPVTLKVPQDGAVTVDLAPSVDDATPSRAAGRPFAMSANIGLSPEVLSFRRLRAAYAKSADIAELTGDVTLDGRGDRMKVTANFDTKPFDLDPLRVLFSDQINAKLFLKENDYDLKMSADRLTYDGRNVAGLDFAATLNDDKLDLQHFNVDRFAGARLNFIGSLSGVSEMRLDALAGEMRGHVSAQKGGEFFSLFDIHAAGLDGLVDVDVDFSSGRAVDSEAALDTLTLKGTLGESRVDAVLKRVEANGNGDDTINLIANAVNANGRLLLNQLGLATSDKLTGAGSASLQMSGPLGKPYETALRVNVAAGTFTAKGTLNDPMVARDFAGRGDVSAADVEMVMAAVGAPDYLSKFVVQQASGPSFVASAKVASNAEMLSLTNLEIVTGNLHVNGDVTFNAARGDKLASLNGRIESNLLDLTPLYDQGSGETLRWSPAAVDLAPMSLFGGEVDLKVTRLRMGSLRFDDANMHLALADDVLSVVPMAAKMAGGNATMTARIEGGQVGEPGIGLTLKLEDAEFAQLGSQVVGAPFAKGRINLELQAEAQGRSWLALVSSINGVGKITTRDAQLSPLNVSGYAAALKGATSVEQLAALSDGVLMTGDTQVEGLDGDFLIKDGLGRVARDALVLDGGKANLTAMLDIPRLAVDSEMHVTLSEPKDVPVLTDTTSGRIGEMTRRIDTRSVQQFAARMILAKSIEDAGLKDVPGELNDLIGLSGGASAGPSVAGIPLPMPRPSLQ